MKRGLFILIFLVLFIPLVTAEVNIDSLSYSKYNLGDKIQTSINIDSEKEINGFLDVKIDCEGKKITYFMSPLNLKKEEQISVDIPPLQLFEDLRGDCYLKADIKEFLGDILESDSTESFRIVDDLDVFLTTPLENFSPKEEIEISATIKNIKNEKIDFGTAIITFLGEKAEFNFTNGKFTKLIVLQKDIKSGEHKIKVEVEDEYKNQGSESIYVAISQIPTSIENILEKDEIKPEEILIITPILYDQAKDKIEAQGTLTIHNTKNKNIYEQEITSGEEISFEIDTYSIPGQYIIKTEINDITKETNFEVEEIKALFPELIENDVVITNIGNVKYDGEILINFANTEKTTKLLIEPQAQKSIRLNSGQGEVIIFTSEKEFNLGKADIPKQGVIGAIIGNTVSLSHNDTIKNIFLIVLAVIIIILILLLIKKSIKKKINKTPKHHKKRDSNRERDFEEGKAKLKKMMEEREKRRGGMGNLFPFAKKIKEEDAIDFRNSMLKSIEDDKKKKGKGIFTKKQEKPFEYGRGYKVIKSKPKHTLNLENEIEKTQSEPYTYNPPKKEDDTKPKSSGLFSMFD